MNWNNSTWSQSAIYCLIYTYCVCVSIVVKQSSSVQETLFYMLVILCEEGSEGLHEIYAYNATTVTRVGLMLHVYVCQWIQNMPVSFKRIHSPWLQGQS